MSWSQLIKRRHDDAQIGLVFVVIDWFSLGWLIRELGPNLGENPFMVIGRSAIVAFFW
jgi:hypothetical protein